MDDKKIKLHTNSSVRVNAALFLISFSIFLYQVCLLRIISISDYYHFAFLVVSIALLGFGISGSFLHYFISIIKNRTLILLIFSFSFSVSVFASYLLINIIPFDSFKIAWETRQVFYLLAYYFCLLLPFYFGGSFIGYIFYDVEKPQVTYFFNLSGSAAGAIIFIFLFEPIGRAGIILTAVALGIIATSLIITRRYLKSFIPLGIVFLTFISSVFLFFPESIQIKMSPYKSLPVLMRIPQSNIIYTRENAISKIDIIESPSIKSVPGLSLQYQKIPPEQIGITVDGDNLMPLTKIAGRDITEFDFLEYIPSSVVFSLMDFMLVKEDFNKNDGSYLNNERKLNNAGIKNMAKQKILFIEPGGGLDVLAGIYFDNKKADEKNNYEMTLLTNNSLIIEVLENPSIKDSYFIDYTGSIFQKENINLIEASSRNYAKETDKKFDLIMLSLPESYRTVSTGAYSLNENYLYTVDSFTELLKILSGDGILAINRWVQIPPSEELKIISTLAEGCHFLGIDDVHEKIFAFRSWSTATVLFKNSGFTPGEKMHLEQKLQTLNYDLIYSSEAKPQDTNIYNQLAGNLHHYYFKDIIESGPKERNEIYNEYYFNIKPATDNRPYFYDFFKYRQIPDIIQYFGKTAQPFGGGGYMVLVFALLISVILSIILIIIPVKIRKIKFNIKSDYKYLIYFTALGIGFFFIELPFIQKFILVLGKPVYSLSVIIFAILISASLGSYACSKLKIDLKIAAAVIIFYILIFIFFFAYIQGFLISKPLWQRFIYTILIIFPLGFFMGIPFPSGIQKAKKNRPEIIPWLWAVNGCFSVIGSISAVIISIHAGFLLVIAMSAALYLSALITYNYIDS